MKRAPIRTLRHDASDQPFIVIWEVTRACDLACKHCRADAVTERHPYELTTNEGRQLLADLSELQPKPLVVLTGGDPFVRPDLLELVRFGASCGLSVALSPSVTPLLTPQALADAAAAGAKAVSLSLDGADAATHDAFRGIAGVFDATFAAARQVREAGLRLQINTTVTAPTVTGLPRVLEHVLALDVSLWSVFFLVPTGRGNMLESLDAVDVEDVLHWLCEISSLVAVKTTEAPHFRRVVLQRANGETGPRGQLFSQLMDDSAELRARASARRSARPPLDVNAGRGFVFIDHIGAVYPSGFLPIPVGSVREARLTELYRNAVLLRMLRDPDRLSGRCGACEFRTVCGGSRSRAWAVHGSALAEDPACAYAPTGGGMSGAAMSLGRV